MSDSILELRGVWKSFGDKAVLRGLDLRVEAGEILTVLGASGSGKSVLLKLIVGLLPLDGGEILFHDQHVEHMSQRQLIDVRRRVGMVFQGGALFDSLTVGENVAYGLEEHFAHEMNRAAIASRVASALESVGLAGTEEMMPAALSGGMRKRVAVARTVALRPEVILYDEPTTGLDPINAARIAQLITEMRDQLHVTSLVVTHDMATAFSISNRLAFIDEGRVCEIGTAADLRASRDARVQDFITGRVPTAERRVHV